MIESKQSAIRLRSKDKLTFHVPVGRRDMSPDYLAENIETIVSRLERVLEKASITLSLSMSRQQWEIREGDVNGSRSTSR